MAGHLLPGLLQDRPPLPGLLDLPGGIAVVTDAFLSAPAGQVYRIMQGDYGVGFIEFLLQTQDGAPIDLSQNGGGTVTLVCSLRSGFVSRVLELVMTNFVATQGWVRYIWQQPDITVPGFYDFQSRIDWGSGGVTRVRNDGMDYFEIMERLAA